MPSERFPEFSVVVRYEANDQCYFAHLVREAGTAYEHWHISAHGATPGMALRRFGFFFDEAAKKKVPHVGE